MENRELIKALKKAISPEELREEILRDDTGKSLTVKEYAEYIKTDDDSVYKTLRTLPLMIEKGPMDIISKEVKSEATSKIKELLDGIDCLANNLRVKR